MKRILLVSLLLLAGGVCATGTSSPGIPEMASRFLNPTKTDRPWVYWYWLNGNINEQGLMADLESMDSAGIGTAMAFDIGIGVPGKVIVRSPEWYALMKKVILKADELGMRIGFNCPGWANAGGPWITPETAMKELVWSECHVTGGDRNVTLPPPPSRMGFYRDIAVLAFPSVDDDNFSLAAHDGVVTDTLGNIVSGSERLFDNNRDTWVKLPGTFDVSFDEPQTIRSMQVRASNIADSRFFVADLWYRDEETGQFRHVAYIPGSPSGLNDRPGMGSASFAPVKAKQFRLGFKTGYNNTSVWAKEVYLQELDLQGGYRMPCWHNKTGFGHQEFLDYHVAATDNDIVDPDRIQDITEKMNPDGSFDWTAPAGKWTVVRLGYIPTGAMSQPLNRGLNSLECDKFSKEAAKVQYDSLMEPLFKLVGRDVAGRVFSNYHVDSYEVGWQNWSEVLPDEFKNRRGYDMRKYLVALTGRAVSSVEETDAFLWDFRRTMADCYADNHIGYFTERAEKDGMFFSIEAYDGPFEDLQTAGRANMPMSEIWQNSDPEFRPRAASMFAAHIYDRELVGSEQYTGMGTWDLHPWKFKALADASMAYGINNFVMHVYTQQPWTDENFKPGATLGPWGAHYDRANTWFSQSRPWHDYIARCQYMLRQGKPVADYLHFLGDNAPGGGGNIPLNPPYGYEGDALNGEVLQKLKVKDGLFVLPSGKTYHYLSLPLHGQMTLASLKKIHELVVDGGIVVGPRPKQSCSLVDLNAKDEFRRLVADIFENDKYSGNVYENETIPNIIVRKGLPADFACDNQNGLNLKFNHRKGKDFDIYFVSNISTTASASVKCSFRVGDMIPEEWNPMNGDRNPVVSYFSDGTQTTIPLHFDVGETKFIVFSKDGIKSGVSEISVEESNMVSTYQDNEDDLSCVSGKNGSISLLSGISGKYKVTYTDGKSKTFKVRKRHEDIVLDHDWTVSFETRLLSPAPVSGVLSNDGKYTSVIFDNLDDWSTSSEEGIRYYSGTATYEKEFEIPAVSSKERCILDLGTVEVIARVFVNGKEIETLWKPPFTTDITEYIKKGINSIRIDVTNLWPNRLIGDEQYPDDVTSDGNWRAGELFSYPEWVWNEGERPEKRRVAFTTYKHWNADSELFPSGMKGPVRITFPVQVEL